MSEDPAETLRRAAKLMRERAEAAAPGPWLGVTGIFREGEWPCVITAQGDPKDPQTWLLGAGNGGANREADADHAGFWHPLVAAAVADLLDREAALIDAQVFPQSDPDMEKYPLAVARAYLGEPS